MGMQYLTDIILYYDHIYDHIGQLSTSSTCTLRLWLHVKRLKATLPVEAWIVARDSVIS